MRLTEGNQRRGIAQDGVESIKEFLRQAEARVPRAATFDLSCDELAPARLDPRKLAQRRALHFRDGGADLREHPFLLIFGQRWPCLTAESAGQARDDEIGPAITLAFEHDFRNWNAQPPAQLRERPALRDELTAKHRWKYLQDQLIAETDDKIGAGGENMRRCRFQTVAVRNV